MQEEVMNIGTSELRRNVSDLKEKKLRRRR
jgi:hypothetical protein